MDNTDRKLGGLTTLLEEHRSAILRFLFARTGNAHDADDVIQELWLRVSSATPGPIANGRAYLFRMAQNLVLDRVREAKRRDVRERDWADVALDQRADGPEPSSSNQADDELVRSEDAARLARAIDGLPPGAGRAFRLHKIDGLSHAQTAAQLGISRKGVEKHMATAMTHLRRALAEDELG